MRTVGRKEQVLLDQLAEEKLGLNTLLLMEHAALAVVKAILDLSVRSVSFLCGKGMNGGDAYAAARLLYGQVDEIRLFESSDVHSNEHLLANDTRINRNSCIALGLQPLSFDAFWIQDGDLIVDALYGTGFQIERGMSDEILSVLKLVQNAKDHGNIKILAVDLPSGVDANNGRVHERALIADQTVSFIYPKTGIVTYPGRTYAGEVIVDPIGLPSPWLDQVWAGEVLNRHAYNPPLSIERSEIKQRTQTRMPDSHKGTNGRVTILAGSQGMAGAAILSTRAAIKAGGGLVRIVVPEALEGHAIHAVPSALIATLTGDLEMSLAKWSSLIAKEDAVAIGPGLGQASLAIHKALIFYAIEHAPRLVLDADSLNILSHDSVEEEARQLLQKRQAKGMELAVLTPHPGEAKRMLKEDPDLVTTDRLAASLALQEKWSSVIVLKGAGTIVRLPSRVWINTSGNAGMGKGGSGDLLSGMLVSFLGQGIDLETAVIAAVYLHGRAADLAVLEGHERALIPDELLDYLADAYMEVEWH